MKLQEEKLNELRSLASDLQNKKMILAEAVIELSSLESKKSQALMQVKTTAKKLEELLKSLRDEHGEVNINLSSGEMTPEKKTTRRRTKSK